MNWMSHGHQCCKDNKARKRTGSEKGFCSGESGSGRPRWERCHLTRPRNKVNQLAMWVRLGEWDQYVHTYTHTAHAECSACLAQRWCFMFTILRIYHCDYFHYCCFHWNPRIRQNHWQIKYRNRDKEDRGQNLAFPNLESETEWEPSRGHREVVAIHSLI